jgi:hypothetical protein
LALLLVETHFFRRLIPDLSQPLVIIIFLASVLVIGLASGYLEWKFSELEETPGEDLQ